MKPRKPKKNDVVELQRRVSEMYDGLSDRLKQVARYVVEHPNNVAFGTVAAVANEAHVPPSTLVRFAKAVGYEGFSALQRVCRDSLMGTMHPTFSYRERLDQLLEHASATDNSPNNVLQTLCFANGVALESAADYKGSSAFSEAVDIISKVTRVHLCAHRRMYPVVVYLAYALSHFGMDAYVIDGAGGMRQMQINRVHRGDSLFVATYPPYAEETVHVVKEVSKKHVPVVALTDSRLSPVASLATTTLEVHDAEIYGFRSLATSMCVAQALAVSVGLARERLHKS